MARSIADYLSDAASNPMVLAGLAMYQASQNGGPGPIAGFGQGLQAYGQAQMQQQQMALEQARANASMQYTQALTEDTQDRRANRKLQREQEEAQRLQQQELQRQIAEQWGPMAGQIAGAYGINPAISLYKGDQLMGHRENQLAEQARANQARESRLDANARAREARAAGGGRRKVPTPSYILEEPLGDGRFQKYKFDENTGQHVPFGKPFKKGSTMSDYLLGDPGAAAPAGPQPYNPQTNPNLPGGNAGPMARMLQQQAGSALPPGSPLMMQPQGQPNAEMQQDFAQARQLIQQNPQMAGEINRRLQQKYGRGL